MRGYHEGQLGVQRRAGDTAVAERLGHGFRAELPEAVRDFLAGQRLLIAGAAAPDGRIWASVLAGEPGFLDTPDDRTVAAAALPQAGDPLAGTLAAGPAPVGLLALEPQTRRRVRVNGTAELVAGGVRVRTEQVYGNCPKYIARRAVAAEAAADAPAPPVERRAALSAGDRALIAQADTFFIATAGPGGGADASHRGGSPGFVAVRDEHRLSFPDYPGNTMFMTLGNLAANPRAGLVFVDWERGDTLQLSGRAVVDWSPERAAALPGAERVVDVEVDAVVRAPRALPLRWVLEERSRFNPPVGRG